MLQTQPIAQSLGAPSIGYMLNKIYFARIIMLEIQKRQSFGAAIAYN